MNEIVVSNAGEIMLLWEVGRLQQIYFDCFKGFRKTSAGAWSPDGKGWEIALQLIRELQAEWTWHAEMFEHHVNEYRNKINDRLPTDLDGVASYLGRIEVDASAIAGGAARDHDEIVVNLASVAGLRKAEIAIAVADSALSVLEQGPCKRFQDLKVQVEMLLAERMSERLRVEEVVRASLIRRRLARHASDIRLMAICTTRHALPCAVWRPSIRGA